MNTIEETIKMAGFGKKKIIAKQIQMFEDRLSEKGENLVAVCSAMKGMEQLYVSDIHVILHEINGLVTNTEKSIPLDSVSSINLKAKGVFASLEVIATGNSIFIDNVPVAIAKEVKEVIEHLKLEEKKQESYLEESKTASFEPIDELRKYKQLLDEGILTQEEFDAKKKQLLSI